MHFVEIAVTILLFGASGCRAQDKSDAPPEYRRLLEAAASAINSDNRAALEALTEGDPVPRFAWINATPHRNWQADLLTLPPPANETAANAPESFVVLHQWHTCESDGDHVFQLVKTAAGWKFGAEIPETETGGFRLYDHDLRVRFDLSQKTAILQDTAQIERTADSVPSFALFRLSEDFHLSRLTDEAGQPVPFAQAGGIVAFTPPKAAKFALKLEYNGKVDHKVGDYIRENELTLNSYWYPHIARLPATATVTITAPSGWTAIGQGEPTAEKKEADGSVTRTFRNAIPTCFFTVDAGKYVITKREITLSKARKVTLAIYLLSADDALAKKSLDVLERSLKFFDAQFSPFPYTHYTLVETQGPFPGALEAYSFATFSLDALRKNIAHELSHTWWGGLLPCPYTKSMWNEALAEYSERLFYRLAGQGLDWVPELAPRPQIARAFRDFPLTAAHDTEDDRQTIVGYAKGSLALHALGKRNFAKNFAAMPDGIFKNAATRRHRRLARPGSGRQ